MRLKDKVAIIRRRPWHGRSRGLALRRRGRQGKASTIAHHAMDHDLSLKEAALQLGFVSEEEVDRVVDPAKMVRPYVAAGPSRSGAAVARG